MKAMKKGKKHAEMLTVKHKGQSHSVPAIGKGMSMMDDDEMAEHKKGMKGKKDEEC